MAIIKCPECGADISDKATSCPKCGIPINGNNNDSRLSSQILVNSPQPPASTQNVVVLEKGSHSNGCANAGLIMAILGLLLGWIPVVGWIIWLSGFVLCVIGLFKTPRVMAIVGLVITFIDFVLTLLIIGGMASALGDV